MRLVRERAYARLRHKGNTEPFRPENQHRKGQGQKDKARAASSAVGRPHQVAGHARLCKDPAEPHGAPTSPLQQPEPSPGRRSPSRTLESPQGGPSPGQPCSCLQSCVAQDRATGDEQAAGSVQTWVKWAAHRKRGPGRLGARPSLVTQDGEMDTAEQLAGKLSCPG